MHRLGCLLISVSGICFGSIPIFSGLLREKGVSSLQQSIFRILFSILLLFATVLFTGRLNLLKIDYRDFFFFGVYGLLGVAIAFTTYLSSVSLGTPVALAILLVYLYPAFSIILARFLLKERLTVIRMLSLVLSTLGAVAVGGFFELYGEVSLPGVVLALATGVFLSTYIVLSRLTRLRRSYHPVTVTFWPFIFGLMWMGPLGLILNSLVHIPQLTSVSLALDLQTWILILCFAVVATVLPYAFLNFGAKYMPASQIGILLLVEIVSASGLGHLVLHEPVGPAQIPGTLLIVGAAAFVSIEDRIKRKSSWISEVIL